MINKEFMPGECVRIPDGRIGRLRSIDGRKCRIRVLRQTSKTHQFLFFSQSELTVVACPRGWMSVEGYICILGKLLSK